MCAEQGVRYLGYTRFAYGKKVNASLAEFQRRHGFERMNFPRYYVRLTPVGRTAARWKLYREVHDILPDRH